MHPKSPELRKSYDEFREERRKEGKTVLLSIVEERAQERGEKIGEKRGATMKALAVAARMLDRGEPREKILDYVEISPKELDKLIESRRN